MKNQIYIFTARGYSKGPGFNYCKVTVVKTIADTPHPEKYAWWNRKIFKVVERSGKLYSGRTENCQLGRHQSELRSKYPDAKYI